MFKKILVVVNTTTDAKGVFTIALAYAKSCQSLLRLVDLSADRDSLIRPSLCSEQSICELAEQWEADLIVIGSEQPVLNDAPCSILQVQYEESTGTTSVQMLLKQKRFACDRQVRQRLEVLYAN
jgi:hypothetical protein